MVKCIGCGFNVETYEVYEYVENSSENCVICKNCKNEPKLKESYRRGFNAGLEAMKKAVVQIVDQSNLRKFPF